MMWINLPKQNKSLGPKKSQGQMGQTVNNNQFLLYLSSVSRTNNKYCQCSVSRLCQTLCVMYNYQVWPKKQQNFLTQVRGTIYSEITRNSDSIIRYARYKQLRIPRNGDDSQDGPTDQNAVGQHGPLLPVNGLLTYPQSTLKLRNCDIRKYQDYKYINIINMYYYLSTSC
ncbi:hypothetical protein ABPG72_020012 [Tetrahymena utriculariae]